ncbi:MAG TPA: response regulator, partial [Anaeromyxobacteraceae bacterium]|nr:response regulator [Anaeromyxobacteraceae bacterium]
MAGRILLVDDDISEIAAVKRVLQRAGHRAVLATNASDALSAVASLAPDLAVVAADCDGGGGEEVARRLAAGPGPAVPVVLLGEAVDGVPARALARPVDAGALEEEVA